MTMKNKCGEINVSMCGEINFGEIIANQSIGQLS